jgi:hypothetical protein
MYSLGHFSTQMISRGSDRGIRRKAAGAVAARLGLALLFFAGAASADSGAPKSLAGSSDATKEDRSAYVLAAAKALVEFCSSIDSDKDDKLKMRADVCVEFANALKTTAENLADARDKEYQSKRRLLTDQQSDENLRAWGTLWQAVLWCVDGVIAVFAIAVLIGATRGADRVGLLREPATERDPKGKISYSRVIGLVGGLGSLLFVALITNICLSYLFKTGKMPDQLGTTYAAAVGAFLTALVPYVINQLNQPASSSPAPVVADRDAGAPAGSRPAA